MLSRIAKSFHNSANQLNFFCYQCEQTVDGRGCSKVSNCGKTEKTAVLQDLLIENIKDLSYLVDHIKTKDGLEISNEQNTMLKDIQEFTIKVNYATLTNVNFDDLRFSEYLKQAQQYYKSLENSKLLEANEMIDTPFNGKEDWTLQELIEKGYEYSIQERQKKYGEDVVSLQELITYGLKGYAGYLFEASIEQPQEDYLFDFYSKAFGYLSEANGETNTQIDKLFETALEVGKYNIDVMAALDKGHCDNLGTPSPHELNMEPVKGKCIVVSGHNLHTLKLLLEQTEGLGINIYTHGELLNAISYPELNKFPHLVGNYGDSWQSQKTDFAKFPGAILMTTNCLLAPKKSYKHRIFSHSVVGHPDVKHIIGDDFSEVIEAALKEKGFKKDKKPKMILTGFGHDYVMSIADVLVNAVKDGDIKGIWLIGGCNGAKEKRDYYTRLAQKVPKDHIILTLACGKFKINRLDLGTISTQGIEIPRILDVGQCNDAYSAIAIVAGLAEAFGLEDINDLPIHYSVSWFEQKAAVVLLSLLHLGIKNIKLGPSLPAFLSPNVLQVLVEKFNISPIADVDEDLSEMLQQ